MVRWTIGPSLFAGVAALALPFGACSTETSAPSASTGTSGIDGGAGSGGESSGSGGTNSVPIFEGGALDAGVDVGTPESVCRALVLASCARRQHCSPTIDRDSLNCSSYADLCPAYYFDSSDRTAEQIAGCLPMVRDRSCSDVGLDLVRGCGTPPGKRDNGQPCLFAGQCASGACSGSPKICGSCVASTLRTLGDNCTAVNACLAGTFCHPASHQCSDRITYGAVGAPCDNMSDPVLACEKDLVCLVVEGGTTGTCQPPGTEGQPCPSDKFTGSHRCMEGLDCVPHGVSSTCDNRGRCGATICNKDSYCAMAGGTPTCTPKALLGAPCGGELVCVSPIQCTRVASDGGAQCLKPEIGLLGESCNPNGCLGAYACRDGKCVPYPTAECAMR